jgi:hypothetical protein
VVINEFMTSGNEFIELLALDTVDLSGWSLSGAVNMILPTRFLLSGDSVVVAKDPVGILAESFKARDAPELLPASQRVVLVSRSPS